MFKAGMIQVLALVCIIALLTGQRALALLTFLALLTIGIAHLWRKLVLRGVVYERTLSLDHVFPNDDVVLTLRLTNRKLLPITRLDMYDRVPLDLDEVDTELISVKFASGHFFYRTVSMSWYETITWTIRLRCKQRGMYHFGPLHMRSGDPFGFFPTDQDDPATVRLVVYPRLLPLDEFPFTMRQLLGDIRAQQQLIVDPMRTVGVRDYHRDDPLKSIHWNATARRGALQTRIYEPTTALDVVCFLDIETYTHIWQGVQRAEVERLISTAATVCKRLSDAGHAVGLWTNSAAIASTGITRVPPSRSAGQLAHLLEALAALTPYSILPIHQMLRYAHTTLAMGTTVLLITHQASDATRAMAQRMRNRGHPLVWLVLGRERPSLPNVSIYHLPTEPARRWANREEAA